MTGWDERISLAGLPILSRDHHADLLDQARRHLARARFWRIVGEHARAARELRLAGISRRMFTERTTPAPAPPAAPPQVGRWVWMPDLRDWMALGS